MSTEDYKHVPQERHEQELVPCPLCGGATEMWSYEGRDLAQKLVCCTTKDPLADWDEGLVNTGCPLYLPDARFYQPTYRQAAKFHKDFSAEMTRRRRETEQACTLQTHIKELVGEDSLRSVAERLGLDHVYLHRMLKGDKTNPSQYVLSKLGLEVTTIYRRTS